ncbi:unnamed protein product [Pleuronectes platessa]|uniref:Uncharacterized protein n=1 Tax=Pleuronectes platessa TaxID=8262 RepID=A0A9N7VBN2_PLEPL|nr:unnamed protein product [Pleuronectes platessa]
MRNLVVWSEETGWLLLSSSIAQDDPQSHAQTCPEKLIPFAHAYLTSPLCYQGMMTKMQSDTQMATAASRPVNHHQLSDEYSPACAVMQSESMGRVCTGTQTKPLYTSLRSGGGCGLPSNPIGFLLSATAAMLRFSGCRDTPV